MLMKHSSPIVIARATTPAILHLNNLFPFFSCSFGYPTGAISGTEAEVPPSTIAGTIPTRSARDTPARNPRYVTLRGGTSHMFLIQQRDWLVLRVHSGMVFWVGWRLGIGAWQLRVRP